MMISYKSSKSLPRLFSNLHFMNDSLCSSDPPIINKNVSLKMTGSWKARDPLGVGTVSCCKCKENCPLIWDTVKTPTFPCTVAPQIKTDIRSAVTSRKHVNSFENIMSVLKTQGFRGKLFRVVQNLLRQIAILFLKKGPELMKVRHEARVYGVQSFPFCLKKGRCNNCEKGVQK